MDLSELFFLNWVKYKINGIKYTDSIMTSKKLDGKIVHNSSIDPKHTSTKEEACKTNLEQNFE